MSEVPLYLENNVKRACAERGIKPRKVKNLGHLGWFNNGGVIDFRVDCLKKPRVGQTAKSFFRKDSGLDRVMQGYLAHKKRPLPQDPTVGLSVGPYASPREGGDFF